jgi:hypothetical protein
MACRDACQPNRRYGWRRSPAALPRGIIYPRDAFGRLISVAVPWIAAQPFWSSLFRLSARAACAHSGSRSASLVFLPLSWKGPSSDRAQQWTRQAYTNLRRGRFWGLERSHAGCAFAHERTGVQAPDAASHGRRSAPSKDRPEDAMESIGDACPECRRPARDQETTDMCDCMECSLLTENDLGPICDRGPWLSQQSEEGDHGDPDRDEPHRGQPSRFQPPRCTRTGESGAAVLRAKKVGFTAAVRTGPGQVSQIRSFDPGAEETVFFPRLVGG